MFRISKIVPIYCTSVKQHAGNSLYAINSVDYRIENKPFKNQKCTNSYTCCTVFRILDPGKKNTIHMDISSSLMYFSTIFNIFIK